MAGWLEAVKPHVDAGKLAVIGIVQEQHADRARLYRQWKKISWPIFIDALNLLDLAVVPVPLGLDESGVVRLEGLNRDALKAFVERDYPKTDVPPPAPKPELSRAASPRERGDIHVLHDPAPDALDRAVEAFAEAVRADASDARARFRLGVAHRARYDSPRRRGDDAQKAVEHWQEALGMSPNMYIWRRRLQQYGPRLDKPYDFYFWVEEARKDIRARGETPVPLSAEPTGSEIAPPAKGAAGPSPAIPDPDPMGRIVRDAGLVKIEPAAVPLRARPGSRIRFRVTFRLDAAKKAHWNNGGDPLTLSVALPAGLSLVEGAFSFPPPPQEESDELRILEFEAALAETAPAGPGEIRAYAIYDVCEDRGGVCRHLRQDVSIPFVVDPKAPKLQ